MICAESKNFTEARGKLGTSSSALGNQLDTLEKELKVKLFERVNQNRAHKLTTEGKMYFDLVKRVNAHLEGTVLLGKLRIADEKEERLDIVTTPGLASIVLPPIISKYHEQYPNVLINLKAEAVARKISPNEVMIRADFKIQRDVKRIFLFTAQMNLYASKEYVRKYGKPKSLDELGEHKNLVLEIQNFANTNWATVHIGMLNKLPTINSNSINFLYEMCKNGHGLLELPNVFMGVESLEKIFEDKSAPKVDIYLSYHIETQSNEHVMNFIKFIREEVKDLLLENCWKA